jgi:RecA-family ATPase
VSGDELPVCRAAQLELRPQTRRWLVEDLWAEQAVGIVGGEPKCGKSFLALDLAVAVASGTPALRRYAVPHPGPVVLFAAEDPLHVVRDRLAAIAKADGVDFDTLDVHVITRPTLRLDLDGDWERLRQTVAALRPRLLVLDPFVRLHRIDENAAGEVAPLLASLRTLQRQLHTAVLVVHHARKGGDRRRPGQALRGSSELHAWGDSNLYLHRTHEEITLHVEHRAAPGLDALSLELRGGAGLALRAPATPASCPSASDPAERIRQALARAPRPLTRAELRDACRIRTQTLGQVLTSLTACGALVQRGDRYALA